VRASVSQQQADSTPDTIAALIPEDTCMVTQPPSTRRLHLGHFAYMRAVVQGLDTGTAWARYLAIEGQASDARVVRSTTRWIRDELILAAQRTDLSANHHQLARLLRLDVPHLGRPDPPLPRLADFAEAHGLEDDSEAEQIAAFEAHYGRASRRQQRRQRLIHRQLDVLRWLEDQVAQAPHALDPVRAWFASHQADHLEAASLHALGHLVERIRQRGERWYRSVPAIGATKARRLQDWLQHHQASLGLTLNAAAPADTTALQPSTDLTLATIRPLDQLNVPADLDGRHGRHRAPRSHCLLQADDDLAAVHAWLAAKADQPHTRRAYRKEAERFLLWALVERGQALSSLGVEDCSAYRDFLAQPASRWCAPRHLPRWSPAWRPFEGPLSPSAQRYAVTVLANLGSFLADQGYLLGNPWRAVRPPRSATPTLQTGRSLSPQLWRWVSQQADQLPPTSANRRLQIALQLLYATGLRLSEVVAARAGDLQRVHYPATEADDTPAQGWMLRVLGKGLRLRDVPVPDALVAQLDAYLRERGCPGGLEHPDHAPAHLLGKASDWAERALALAQDTDPAAGIAAGTLYDQLKSFFRRSAEQRLQQGDAPGSERIRRASTHWLRHSHASHAIAAGLPIEIAQQNLGHASLATTTRYVSTEHKRRLQALQKVWQKQT
jgi:site-specific recombinase XerD